MGHDSHSGRVLGRIGGGGVSAGMFRQPRLGHGRLDSSAGSLVRLRRVETDLWTGLALRTGGVRFVAGSDRVFHAGRARRGDRAGRAERAGRTGFDERARTGAELRSSLGPGSAGAEAGVAARIHGGRTRSRGQPGHPGSDPPLGNARGGDPRHFAAAHRVRDRDLLHHCDRRGQREPGALRRHSLRLARGRRGSDRVVWPDARGRVRRGGEAAHHPRHLRAEQRLS